MKTMRKRIEVLEKSLLLQDSGADHVIVSQALHRVTNEELQLLEDVAVDQQQGKLNRDLTEGESAAIAAYASALQQELQLAGFSSMAEFQLRHPE
jgi:hypothetical protein